MSVEKRTLDNGLTVYMDHVTGARTNDVRMFVPYGSVDEESGNEGVAHVFEHCVHLKTDMFADRVAIDKHASINGMYTNASTSVNLTSYYANGIEVEPSLVHLSQILQNTHFPEEAVEHELKAVRREMKTGLDNPAKVHLFSAMNAMYGLPYGRFVGGYHDRINFDADTLRSLHDRHYKLGRMALIVTGKAKMDEVSRLAERYFVADDNPTYEERVVPPRVLGGHKTTGLVRSDMSSALVSVSYPTPPEFSDRDSNNILAIGMAQRAISRAAFHALRYQQGISYNGSAGFGSVHPNASVFGGNVSVDSENVGQAVDVFEEVFSRPGSSYDSDILEGSMAAYKYAYQASYNSVSARLDRIETALSEGREPTDLRLINRKIGKIGVAEIRAAIDKISEHTQVAPRYIHVTGPREAVGDAERIIEIDEIA